MTVTTLPKYPHHSTGEFYDPQEGYYFLSYHVISSTKWVRSPFLRLSELKDALDCLPLLLTPGFVPSTNSNLPGLIADYDGLQVYSESWFSELHRDWDESSQSYLDSELTNRQILFGKLYEHGAVRFTGVPSLSRQHDEERDAWCERIDRHRASLKNLRIERMKLHSDLSERQHDFSRLLAFGQQGAC
jgi:hypothetical protein